MVIILLALLFPVLLHASSHERAEQFFLCHYEAAQQLYYCHGIPTELSLSVWALESKYGSSHAATQCNNLGGIKSYEGGKKHNKHFAALDDFYQAFAAIFQQPCYKDMQPQTTGEYLEAMEWACCSYHRSKEYSRKIKWIIKNFKLKEMKWINVKEELPKKDGHFLVFTPRSFPKNCRSVVAEYYMDGKEGIWYSEAFEEPIQDVTHWAILPDDPF